MTSVFEIVLAVLAGTSVAAEGAGRKSRTKASSRDVRYHTFSFVQ
jgi:hypothetical protein